MSLRKLTQGDESMDILRHLMTTNVFLQLNAKGAQRKRLCPALKLVPFAKANGNFNFALLPTHRCCMPRGLPGSYRTSCENSEIMRPVMQLPSQRRLEELKAH